MLTKKRTEKIRKILTSALGAVDIFVLAVHFIWFKLGVTQPFTVVIANLYTCYSKSRKTLIANNN